MIGAGQILSALGLAVAFTAVALNLLAAVGAGLAGVPLPFTRPVAVVADTGGRIYVGDAFYDRVQVFDDGGRFLQSLVPEPRSKSTLRLAIDDADRLFVGYGELRRWTPEGGVAERWPVPAELWQAHRVHLGPDGGWQPGEPPDVVDEVAPVAPGEPLFPPRDAATPFVREGTTWRLRRAAWTWVVERDGETPLTLRPNRWLEPFAFPLPGIPLALGLILLGQGLVALGRRGAA